MKVLGIAGSMRRNRNTDALVGAILDVMTRIEPSFEADVVHTADLDVHPCRVVCHEAHCSVERFRCSISDDVGGVLDRMVEADALILAAPQYFRGPPAGFHTLIERLISMAYFHETAGHPAEGSPLLGKPCGLVGVCEYSDPQLILEYLRDVCALLSMNVVQLRTFPYLGVGAHGAVDQDEVFRPLDRTAELATGLIDAARAYRARGTA